MASIPGAIPDTLLDESASCIESAPGPSSSNVQPDSFKTEFHPKSGHPTTVDSFSKFDRSQHNVPRSLIDDNSEPWHPFHTPADFEFSEIAHKSALNKDQTNRLLALIQKLCKGKAKLTLQSHHDVTEAWNRAAKLITLVSGSFDFGAHTNWKNKLSC